jgi:hypothetical protein
MECFSLKASSVRMITPVELPGNHDFPGWPSYQLPRAGTQARRILRDVTYARARCWSGQFGVQSVVLGAPL